jgi:hypothetical protein
MFSEFVFGLIISTSVVKNSGNANFGCIKKKNPQQSRITKDFFG